MLQLQYKNSRGLAQLSLELRKELNAVVLVVGVEFYHNPFGMCATGIAIEILNGLKSQSAAAPMTRFVLNLELLLVVKDISKVKSRLL